METYPPVLAAKRGTLSFEADTKCAGCTLTRRCGIHELLECPQFYSLRQIAELLDGQLIKPTQTVKWRWMLGLFESDKLQIFCAHHRDISTPPQTLVAEFNKQ